MARQEPSKTAFAVCVAEASVGVTSVSVTSVSVTSVGITSVGVTSVGVTSVGVTQIHGYGSAASGKESPAISKKIFAKTADVFPTTVTRCTVTRICIAS